MSSIPYIPLYISDYLNDTTHLTLAQHGAYLLLIMHYWQTGKKLPKCRKKLSKLLRIEKSKIKCLEEIIFQFFEDDGEFLTHKRIEKDLEKFRQKSGQARDAGIKSGEARREKSSKSKLNGCSTDVQRTFSGCSTDDQRTLNDTDTETDTDTDTHTQTLVHVHDDLKTSYMKKIEGRFSDHQIRNPKTFQMLSDWIKAKVSVDDIDNAFEAKQNENVTVPWYFREVVMGFAKARQDGKPIPGKKMTSEERVQAAIALCEKNDRLRELENGHH